jgi:hypothetical protein
MKSEHLWFVMHHPDDPKGQTLAITCYLDESDTDDKDPQAVVAVVAGLVMHRDSFLMLDVLWDDMLSRHCIEPPLHTKEFGHDGRHGNLNYLERANLFTDVANYINYFKVHSVAATLSHKEYRKIDSRIKKHIGPYGACFMLLAHTCLDQAKSNQYYGDLAFVLEEGNRHAKHVRLAHQSMIEMKKANTIWVHSGSLKFAPKKLSVLQAADVIAWGVRRQASGMEIDKGREPITKIFNEKHIQYKWNDELLKDWSDSINE